jgi:hypothetical protein
MLAKGQLDEPISCTPGRHAAWILLGGLADRITLGFRAFVIRPR